MGLGGDECVLILVVEDEEVGLIEVALDGAWGVVKEDDDLVEVMGVWVFIFIIQGEINEGNFIGDRFS